VQERFAIAAELRKIARLLAIKGENPFKAQAYEHGAAALENLGGDLAALVKAGRLQEIAGIGKALAAVIEEIYRSGECYLLQQLREELPPGAEELSELAGLSLKKIIALDQAGIKTVADLQAACRENRVSGIKGFGAKSQAKLLADIARRASLAENDALPLGQALEAAERILSYLRAAPELSEAAVAGALRRRRETARRIVIVAASKTPRAVIDRFLAFPALAHTEELEENRCRARLAGGAKTEIIAVKPEHFAGALFAATGSRGHVAKLRELARARGAHLLPGDERIRVRREPEIYRQLGLPFIPAELREDAGEIEAALAGQLPELLSLEAIRGMIHCHTIYSDGRHSIEEMARAAEAMGMRYLTITDHSPTAYYARGVGLDRLRAQWDEIDRVQERVKIKILKGTESDILADGVLDYPDALLERFDVIIASIHARHNMDSAQMTARLLRALQLPVFKIWGHPLGRLIPSRPPFDCDMEKNPRCRRPGALRHRDQRRSAPARSRAALDSRRARPRHQIRGLHRRPFHRRFEKSILRRGDGAARLAWRRRCAEHARWGFLRPGRPSMNRLFLLSPAQCGGRRARCLLRKNSPSDLARRLAADGVPLGALFTFLSALYFRGKLAYAEAFARPPEKIPGVLIITPSAGLAPPDAIVRPADLRRFGRSPIDVKNLRYCAALRQSAGALAESLARDCEVVLLGSIASAKYLSLLAPIFGSRLRVPADFIGRGDMSRGGLLLRCVREKRELAYIDAAACAAPERVVRRAREKSAPARCRRAGAKVDRAASWGVCQPIRARLRLKIT